MKVIYGSKEITGNYLEKNHTKACTLDGVENSQPQPERYAEIRSCPGDVKPNGRCTPEHLYNTVLVICRC